MILVVEVPEWLNVDGRVFSTGKEECLRRPTQRIKGSSSLCRRLSWFEVVGVLCWGPFDIGLPWLLEMRF